MITVRTAARVQPWHTQEKEAAEARSAECVVGNVDDDEFEQPEELRKVTVERAPTGKRRREENHSVHRVARSVSSATPASTKETSS